MKNNILFKYLEFVWEFTKYYRFERDENGYLIVSIGSKYEFIHGLKI